MAKQYFVFANCGAGNVKAIAARASETGGFTKRMRYHAPSLALVDSEDFFLTGKKVLGRHAFNYVAGDSSKMVGTYWAFGKAAMSFAASRQANEIQSASLVNASYKTDNALLLLLSCLIQGKLIEPGESAITLALSHHDPLGVGSKLPDLIKGRHTVVKAGETYDVHFSFSEQSVLQEGSEVRPVGYEGEEYGQLDVGGLTSIFTTYLDGVPIRSESSPYGVGELAKMMAESSELKSLLNGVPGNVILVESALMEASVSAASSEKGKGSVIYRSLSEGKAIKIDSAYLKVARRWLPKAIGRAINAISAQPKGYKVVAIGGGVLLPSMKQMLQKANVDLYDGDCIMADVESSFAACFAELKPENPLKLVKGDRPFAADSEQYLIESGV